MPRIYTEINIYIYMTFVNNRPDTTQCWQPIESRIIRVLRFCFFIVSTNNRRLLWRHNNVLVTMISHRVRGIHPRGVDFALADLFFFFFLSIVIYVCRFTKSVNHFVTVIISNHYVMFTHTCTAKSPGYLFFFWYIIITSFL